MSMKFFRPAFGLLILASLSINTLHPKVEARGVEFSQASEKWVKDIRAIGLYALYPMREEYRPGTVFLSTSSWPTFATYYREGALYKGWPIPYIGPFPPLAPVWGEFYRYTRNNTGSPKPMIRPLGNLPGIEDKLETLLEKESVLSPNNKTGIKKSVETALSLFEERRNKSKINTLIGKLTQAKSVNKIVKGKVTQIKQETPESKARGALEKIKQEVIIDISPLSTQDFSDPANISAVENQLQELFSYIKDYLQNTPGIAKADVDPSKAEKLLSEEPLNGWSINDVRQKLKNQLSAPDASLDKNENTKQIISLIDSFLEPLGTASNSLKQFKQARGNSLFTTQPGQLRKRQFPAFSLRNYTVSEAAAFMQGHASGSILGQLSKDQLVDINLIEAESIEVPMNELKIKIKPQVTNIMGCEFKPNDFLSGWAEYDTQYVEHISKLRGVDNLSQIKGKVRFRFLIAREVIYIKKAKITVSRAAQLNARTRISPVLAAGKTQTNLPVNVYNLFPGTGTTPSNPTFQLEELSTPGIAFGFNSVNGEKQGLDDTVTFERPMPFAMRPVYIQVDATKNANNKWDYEVTKISTHFAF